MTEQTHNPIAFDTDDIRTAVHEAVGAASVCWTDMAGTGVFDDRRARDVAEALIDWLDRRYQRRTTPVATTPASSAAPVDPVMAGSPVEMPRRVDLADVRPGDRVRISGGSGWHVEGVVHCGVPGADESAPGGGLCLVGFGPCRLGERIELLSRPPRLPVVGEPVTDEHERIPGTIVRLYASCGQKAAVLRVDDCWHYTDGMVSAPGALPHSSNYVVAFVPEPTT